MKTLQAVGVGFGLAVGFAAACVAFVMCGAAAVRSGAAANVEPEAPAVELPAEPSTAQPAPEPEPAFEVNIATFRNDQLDECLDFQILPLPGQEAAAQKHIDKLETINTSKKPLLLSKPCAEQFAGRTLLAMCSFTKDADFGRVSISTHHYSPHNVVANDGAMRDCISMNGNWQANPDARAVRTAQRRELLQRAQEMAGELK